MPTGGAQVQVRYGAVHGSAELGEAGGNSGQNGTEKRSLLQAGTSVLNDGLFGPGARRTDNNRIFTVILVLNYMIGSGILNSAQIFSRSGVVTSTVLFVVACIAIWLGGTLLIRAADVFSPGPSNGKSVPHEDAKGSLDDLELSILAKRTMGEQGDLIADTCITVLNFGSVCSYVVLVGGLTTSILAEWHRAFYDTGVRPAWDNFFVITPFMFFFFVLPPCLVRHLSNLRWLAVFSLLAITAVVCLVMFGGPVYGAAERAQVDHDPELDAPLLLLNWTGTFAKFGSAVFALTSTPAALHNYSAMHQRNPREWCTVMIWASVLGAALCYVTGLLGYMSFRGATEGDILDNFMGPVASCFKILVLVHLILYIPHETVVLRHSVFGLMGHDVMEKSFGLVALATFGLLAFIVSFVMVLMSAGIAEGELFGYILDLTGGITGSLISFVIPAVAYLRATEGNDSAKHVDNYRWGAYMLCIFGSSLVFMVPTAVFMTAAGMG